MEKMKIGPEERDQMRAQIGRMNILSISGGRVVAIENGLELPVSNGYSVRVELDPMDWYKVSRVFKRGGKEWIKGEVDQVYFDQVGELAYRAGMFRSYDENGWPSGQRS